MYHLHVTHNKAKARAAEYLDTSRIQCTVGLIGPTSSVGCHVWDHGAEFGAAQVDGMSARHLGGSKRVGEL